MLEELTECHGRKSAVELIKNTDWCWGIATSCVTDDNSIYSSSRVLKKFRERKILPVIKESSTKHTQKYCRKYRKGNIQDVKL